MEVNKQKRERREPLLTVDDELLASLMANDDGAKEVVALVLDLCSFVIRLMEVQKLPRQVIDKLTNLPFLPGILTLVEVDGVLTTIQ